MQFIVDDHDPASILAHVRNLSRQLEPILRRDLPALPGRRAPSGLARVADAVGHGRLHARGFARDMLPVIVDACTMAIEDGTSITGDGHEAGHSDGGVDRDWHESTVYTEEALSLFPLRAAVQEVIDLLDRIDDLIAAQRDVGDMQH
jgi:hypothetical protein